MSPPPIAVDEAMEESLSLRVYGLHGHLCDVVAERSWHVRDVKEAIEEARGVSRWQQVLLAGTRRLIDEDSVEQYREGWVVDLTLVLHSAEKADWLRAVHDDWSALFQMHEEAWADRDVVLGAVSICGSALKHASTDLQADREVVLRAVAKDGLSLQYAAPDLRGDKEVGLAAVKQCGRALDYVAEELRGDRDFTIQAVSLNGRALRHSVEDFRSDREVVLAAVRQTGTALAGASAALRADYGLVAEALQQDGKALAFASPPLRADLELQAMAADQDHRSRRGTAATRTSSKEEPWDCPTSTSCSFGRHGSDGHLGLHRLLGDAGAMACEMARLGLPVPPGFCLVGCAEDVHSLGAGMRPTELEALVKLRLAELECSSGRRFGARCARPLVLSVSGHGALATVGLTDEVVEAWVREDADSLHFVWDAYRRHITAYAREVKHLDMSPFDTELAETLQKLDAKCQLGRKHHDSDIPVNELQRLVLSYKLLYQQITGVDFPQDPEVQLWEALSAALAPQERPATVAAAAMVQAMVFGNFGPRSAVGIVELDAGTISGEWLATAECKDVLAGSRNNRKVTKKASQEWASQQGHTEQDRVMCFASLEEEMPGAFADLLLCHDTLSCHDTLNCHDTLSAPAVEFVVQQGELWLVRKAEPCNNACCWQSTIHVLEGDMEDEAAPRDDSFDQPAQIQEVHLNPAPGQESPCRREPTFDRGAAPLSFPRRWGQECTGSDARQDCGGGDEEQCCSSRAAPAHEGPAATGVWPVGMLKLPLWQTLLAGGLAGVSSRWLGNAADSFAYSALREGLGRAAVPRLLASSFAGCRRALPTGAICTTFYFNLLAKASPDGNPDGTAPLPRLGCAVAAATFANILMHPLDAVSTLPRQTSSLTAAAKAMRGRSPCLYKGLRPALAASVPLASLELCAIDVVRKLGVSTGLEVSPALLVATGALGHVSSQVLLLSFGMVKGSAEGAVCHGISSAPQVPRRCSSLLSGIGRAHVRGIPAAGVNSLVRVGLLTEFLRREQAA